jgi:hypothetical protein
MGAKPAGFGGMAAVALVRRHELDAGGAPPSGVTQEAL